MSDSILTEARGAVLVVELNRPDARNAFDNDVAEGLVAAMTRLDDDPTLRVGVLSGRGSGSCSGMDLKAFAKAGVPKDLDRFLWEGSRKPLVCAIERFALAVALELAPRVAANAPLALMASKRLIRETPGRTEAELVELQKPLFKEVFRSNDAKEGPRAFAEKREPNWSGS